MLTHLAPAALDHLHLFYNHIWNTGTFPDVWHHAIILPFPKPGKDTSYPDNYWPISLTSCLCKLLEKMINSRLNWVLQQNDDLTPTQFGSRPGRSTLDPLILLEDQIKQGFSHRQLTVAVFFDLQKAYDTTW